LKRDLIAMDRFSGLREVATYQKKLDSKEYDLELLTTMHPTRRENGIASQPKKKSVFAECPDSMRHQLFSLFAL
jgi:hypothetical protein